MLHDQLQLLEEVVAVLGEFRKDHCWNVLNAFVVEIFAVLEARPNGQQTSPTVGSGLLSNWAPRRCLWRPIDAEQKASELCRFYHEMGLAIPRRLVLFPPRLSNSLSNHAEDAFLWLEASTGCWRRVGGRRVRQGCRGCYGQLLVLIWGCLLGRFRLESVQ